MNYNRLFVWTLWSVFVIVLTSALLFVFTFGDCVGDARCIAYKNRAFWAVLASCFTLYWIVTGLMIRRWSR